MSVVIIDILDLPPSPSLPADSNGYPPISQVVNQVAASSSSPFQGYVNHPLFDSNTLLEIQQHLSFKDIDAFLPFLTGILAINKTATSTIKAKRGAQGVQPFTLASHFLGTPLNLTSQEIRIKYSEALRMNDIPTLRYLSTRYPEHLELSLIQHRFIKATQSLDPDLPLLQYLFKYHHDVISEELRGIILKFLATAPSEFGNDPLEKAKNNLRIKVLTVGLKSMSIKGRLNVLAYVLEVGNQHVFSLIYPFVRFSKKEVTHHLVAEPLFELLKKAIPFPGYEGILIEFFKQCNLGGALKYLENDPFETLIDLALLHNKPNLAILLKDSQPYRCIIQ